MRDVNRMYVRKLRRHCNGTFVYEDFALEQGLNLLSPTLMLILLLQKYEWQELMSSVIIEL